eukprot:Lithocolla_globosa_v1_NODE_96_length_6498_cov_20.614310.p2 type:complete len:742 gc:universal NODE_96_length_6498_cov_20.614310:1525-3750(+)
MSAVRVNQTMTRGVFQNNNARNIMKMDERQIPSLLMNQTPRPVFCDACCGDYIRYDKNGCIRFEGRRNFRRQVPNCVPLTPLQRCNLDFQVMLAPPPLPKESEEKDRQFLQEHFENKAGLDAQMASGMDKKYTVGYACKGGKSSKTHSHKFMGLIDGMNDNSSMTGVVVKFFQSLTSTRSVPGAEASFTNGGGKYYLSKRQPVRVSLGSRRLGTGVEKNATKDNFEDKYRTYRKTVKNSDKTPALDLSLDDWISVQRPDDYPIYTGVTLKPKWPLTEAFYRGVCMVYLPWDDNVNEHEVNGKYETKAEEFIASNKCPEHLKAEIHLVKIGWKNKEGAHRNKPPVQGKNKPDPQAVGSDSDSSDGEYPEIDEYVRVHQGMMDGQDEYEASSDLFDGGLEWDWSHLQGSYSQTSLATADTWLLENRKLFYGDDNGQQDDLRKPAILPDDIEHLHLFPDIDPEMAKEEQMFLLALLLHHIRLWEEWQKEPTKPKPDQLFLLVQGKPGTGKSYCIKHYTNCIRLRFNCNEVTVNLTPTGTSAGLVGGLTVHRFAKPPRGDTAFKHGKFQFLQGNMPMKLEQSTKFLQSVIGDEFSMWARALIGWLEFRCREGRALPTEHFGGIPVIALFGDVHQLAPVKSKGILDSQLKETDLESAEAGGAITAKLFTDVVVLNEVVRQSDKVFLEILNNMREGKCANKFTVEWFVSRSLQNLTREEERSFWDEALYLFPSWIKANPIIYHIWMV